MNLSLHRREGLLIAAALMVVLALAAILRFTDIGSESYWLDEVYMVRLTGQGFDQLIHTLQTSDRPPVYVLLGYAWVRIFGTSEAATRSLSALAGIACVAVTYLIGRELYRRQVGLLAALIMALSAFQVWYSQEYRYYTVFELVALVAVLFYVVWLKYGHTIDLIVYAVFSALAAYVHNYAIFFYVGLGLHFVTLLRVRKQGRWLWLAAQIFIVLAVLPRLNITFQRAVNEAGATVTTTFGGGTSVVDWLPAPPIYAPLRTLSNFLFVQRSYVSWELVGLAIAVLGLGIAAYALPRREKWLETLRAARQTAAELLDMRMAFLLLWLFCPILITFLLSYLVMPMYLDRYVITAAPAWYLLVALALWTFRHVVPLTVSVAAVLILLGGSLWTYYSQNLKEQWRETAAYIDQRLLPGDSIALSYGNLPGEAFTIRDSFSWYYPAVTTSDCFVDVRADSDTFAQQIDACGRQSERLWLVLYAANPLGNRMTAAHLPAQYPLIESQDFVGTTVYLFDLKP